jgi:hypothetical protein
LWQHRGEVLDDGLRLWICSHRLFVKRTLVIDDFFEVDTKIAVEEDERGEGAASHNQAVSIADKALNVDGSV